MIYIKDKITQLTVSRHIEEIKNPTPVVCAMREWMHMLNSEQYWQVVEEIRSIYKYFPMEGKLGIGGATELLCIYIAFKEGWLDKKLKKG